MDDDAAVSNGKRHPQSSVILHDGRPAANIIILLRYGVIRLHCWVRKHFSPTPLLLPERTVMLSRIVLCCVAAVVCWSASSIAAEVVRYDFMAAITEIHSMGDELGDIEVGTIVHGFFEIDTAAGPFNNPPNPITGGLYGQTTQVNLSLGAFDDTRLVANRLDIDNPAGGPDFLELTLTSESGGGQEYWPLWMYELTLIGTAAMLSDGLPPAPINVSAVHLGQSTLAYAFGDTHFLATLTSIVPEPASAGVMAFAALGLLGRRRRN
jgi:hypothetical protein